MNILKYLIYGLIVIITLSLIVLIIQPENSAVLRPEESGIESTSPDKSTPQVTTSKNSMMEWKSPPVGETIQHLINQTDITKLPPFIQALPINPAEIDRNGNRVRDDLEVFIGYKYPYEPRNRATLTQLVTIWDKIAKDGGKTKMSRQMAFYLEEKMAEACWYKNGFDQQDFALLKSLVLNNKHRKNGYAKAMAVRNAVPQEELNDIVLPEETCDQMQIENQMFLQNWKPED